jgi:hypothetical protein
MHRNLLRREPPTRSVCRPFLIKPAWKSLDKINYTMAAKKKQGGRFKNKGIAMKAKRALLE